MSDLQSTIGRIATNASLLTGSEEATRQGAILPVLSALGWQWHNIDEVVPEYGAGKGRVDYCLRSRGRSAVFVEVKRTGTELHPHQEQLLRYAFEEGIELAVLTDGLVWWLYLPTATGSWEQRRFFSLDIRRVSHERSAQVLARFLARSEVVSGEALARARNEFEDQEKERRIREAFPAAWKQLVEGPDDLLAELVSDAVAGIAGHAPDPEQVATFLAGIELADAGAPKTPPRGLPAKPRRPSRGRSASDAGSNFGLPTYTGRTPKAIQLSGTTHSVSSWRGVLTTVCDAAAAADGRFGERVLLLRGRKRAYFSRVPEELTTPLPVGGTDLFVEGNLSANGIVRLCEAVLSGVTGLGRGFSIQLDESAPLRRRTRRQ